MATTFSWKIDSLPNYPQAEGQQDVVFQVNWTYIGVDGQYTASEKGAIGVTYVAGQPYTPYNELTEEQVIGWITSSIPENILNIYKDSINRNIQNQKEIQILPLPWGA